MEKKDYNVSPRIMVTVDKEQLPYWKNAANNLGISLAALVRVAVGEYLVKHNLKEREGVAYEDVE